MMTPISVYLDLNHWYVLSDAEAGKPRRAADVAILEQLKALVAAGSVISPLSAVHYMEITENPRDQQRHEVADVMAAISRFRTLVSYTKILEEELDIQLNARFGRPTQVRTTPKFGDGFGFAFGKPGRFHIRGNVDAMARLTNEQLAQLAAFENKANALAEWMMIGGPSSEVRRAIPGYEPYAARQVADQELGRIRRMVNNLRGDPSLYRRLDDVLAAQEYVGELPELLTQALERAGIRQNEWLTTRDDLTAFLLALPSRRVSVAIKGRYLQDLNHNWTVNDLRDIMALSIAVPYCDVVVTDRQVCDAVTRAGLDTTFGTTVLRSLDTLATHLAQTVGRGPHDGP